VVIFEGRGEGFLSLGGIEVAKTWGECLQVRSPLGRSWQGVRRKRSTAVRVNERTTRAAFSKTCFSPMCIYHLAVGLSLQRLEDASSMQLDCLYNAA
jgi:hypothetical protein